MKKQLTATFLALCLALGMTTAMIAPASAASVTNSDLASLVSTANAALGKTPYEMGIPAYGWCAYFVGYCINHSSVGTKLGAITQDACQFSISPLFWICGTKNAGQVYMISSIHLSRLGEICPDLKTAGKLTQVSSSNFAPQPGDLALFCWPALETHEFSHIGIVTGVGSNSITYVDGNSGTGNGRVTSHVVEKNSPNVIGYIRFEQDRSTPTAPEPTLSVPTVASVEQGEWAVWIPANYYLPLDAAADSTSHVSSVYARTATYRIGCSERAVLTDGTVRFKGLLNVPGSGPAEFWFTLDGSMEAEDVTHREHIWNDGVVTRYPSLVSDGVITYYCLVCMKQKTESIPRLSPELVETPASSETETGQDVPNQGTPEPSDTFEANHLDRFQETRTYWGGIFRDVADDSWYYENVVSAYELGLMNGTGEDMFQPGKNVTIAEAVVLMARLHSIYYAKTEEFESYDGGNWYDPYVNYARKNGLLSENYDYNRPATRDEFVHILAKALPSEAMKPITDEPVFADAGSIVYGSDVELLSRAGIITGSGNCFLPQNPITRAEMAAVLTRMIKPELRKG